jgi:hypothetical protein
MKLALAITAFLLLLALAPVIVHAEAATSCRSYTTGGSTIYSKCDDGRPRRSRPPPLMIADGSAAPRSARQRAS